MYYIKYLVLVIIFILLQNSNLFAEKIVYLNIEKIMKSIKGVSQFVVIGDKRKMEKVKKYKYSS